MLGEAGLGLLAVRFLGTLPALAVQPLAAPWAMGGVGARAGLTGLRRRSAAPNWGSAHAERT